MEEGRKGTNDRRRNKSLNREEMRRGKKENRERMGFGKLTLINFLACKLALEVGGGVCRLGSCGGLFRQGHDIKD